MDDDYFLPPQDQRPFGAGIARRRVQFVRSSEHELNTTTPSTTTTSSAGPNIANKYLSIVLSKSEPPSEPSESPKEPLPSSISAPASPQPQPPTSATTAHCEVCNLPLTNTPETPSQDLSEDTHPNPPSATNKIRPHEASLAHQLCLKHSHPPSHLDRSRHGLRYLSAYGWDPDSRLGLGAQGREGIREPLKGKLKVDTVGLGAGVQDPDLVEGGGGLKAKARAAAAKAKASSAQSKVQKLNAKQVRKGHADARKRGEELREMFYRSEEVLKYLGS